MEKNNTYNQKSDYTMPEVQRIELDNEIALQLESIPPQGPSETYLNAPEYFNQQPFKTNIG